MKLEIFKPKKKFRKGGFHTNPNIGWEIILFIGLVLIIVALVFGIYFFAQVSKENTEAASGGSSQIKIVKKDRINKAIEYFSARREKSAEILNSPAPVIDPSL